MKTRDKVMTPHGEAIVTEVHSGGKTVKVEMLGSLDKKGNMTWPKPFIRVYSTKYLKVIPRRSFRDK